MDSDSEVLSLDEFVEEVNEEHEFDDEEDFEETSDDDEEEFEETSDDEDFENGPVDPLLRDYQNSCLNVVRNRMMTGATRHTIDMFCGLGKSRIIQRFVQSNTGIQVVVMSSLALVHQFCREELADKKYMVFCSLGDTDTVESATTSVEDARAFLFNSQGIVAVTYQSLSKLMECVEKVDYLYCDESHNVNSAGNEWIFESDRFAQTIYLSATPGKEKEHQVFSFSYADSLTHIDKHTGLEEPYSQDVRLHAGWYTANDDKVALLFNTAFKTGNMRCLSFHNMVNGGDPDSVLEFEKRCSAYAHVFLEKHPEVAKVTVMSIDGTTPQEERNRILAVLDATPCNELCIVCSCKTISEGVNTRRCNLVYFVHPSRSYVSIVQRIGRAVRLQAGCPPATLLIPCFVDQTVLAAFPSKEEQDAYIRTTLYAEGNALFDFLGAIREGDSDLLDLLVDMYKGPQRERLNHYTELLGDRPRVTLAEAVEKATGQRTEDVAAAATRSKRSVEVHPREGPMTQHEGAAAIEASIIEMEPDRYMVVEGAVGEAPRRNRIVVDTTFSPFLQSIRFDEVVGTAIIDYELRPELFEERVQEVIKFVEEYGRLPRQNCKDPEKRLETWCSRCRKNKGKNVERDARVGQIPKWSWDPFADRFEANLQSTIEFVKEHDRLPSKSKDQPEEKRLFQWISDLRKYKGKNAERDDCVKKIPKWSWDPIADRFESNLQSTIEFVKEHDRLPSQTSEDSIEKLLGKWCSRCRTNKDKNPEHDARLQKIPMWSWNPFEDQFEHNLQETIKFVKERGVLPCKNGKDHEEKRLGSWCCVCRKNEGKNPERDARLQKMIPKWYWIEEKEAATYQEMTVAKLQQLLRDRELPVKGSKAMLIARLEHSDVLAGSPEEVEDPAPMEGELNTTTDDVLTEIEDEDFETSPKRNERSHELAGSPEEVEEDPVDIGGEPNTTIVLTEIEEDGLTEIEEDGLTEIEDDGLTEIEDEYEPSPKRKRDDGLENLSKEELVERLRDMKRHSSRGYTAPNPEMKDKINALFASSLPPQSGKVAFLDHTDFKTATACAARGVRPEDMIIPQTDEAAFAQMRRHPTFGASVVFGEFNEVLRGYTSVLFPFRGVYADFTGPQACGLELVEVCKGLRLVPRAVVGVTVTLRDPTGNDSFTNAAIEELSNEMNEELHLVNLRDAEGNKVRPMTYGTGAPMVTIIKRKRDSSF